MSDACIPVVCIVCGIPYRLRDAELVIMEKALEVANGNRTKAAEILGINVRTLRRRLNGGKRA